MTRLLAALLALSLVSMPLEASVRRRSVRVPGAVNTTYLDAALRAARYLETLEQPGANNSLLLPSIATDPRTVSFGLAASSGIGMFHLRLYQVTRDTRWLDKAQRISNAIATRNFTRDDFDWQSGAVGCGSFLMALYRETREPVHLQRAQRIADTLISQAIRDEQGGWHWEWPSVPDRVFTGMAHGAAGVGMLLLQIHEQSPNAQYLAAAEAAATWTRRYTLPVGDGIGWKRLIDDTHAYHGWCGGSSGMVFFLAKLWEVTGKEEYRQLLVQTANGLLAAAQEASGGVTWRQTSHPASPRTTVYCHGNASVIGALAHSFEHTHDARYIDTARRGVVYMDATAETPAPGQRNWPHSTLGDLREFGFMTGTASIGHAFLRLYRHDRDPRHLALAQEAGNFLIANVNEPRAGEWRWPIFADPVPERYAADQKFKTGWWDGTAGIGMYFLELHEFSNGKEPPADFSPANP